MSIKTLTLVVIGLIIGIGVGILAFGGLSERLSGLTRMPITTGAARIGGPFQLTDQNGQIRTDKDFRGKYLLVFFGFLYCPDICPSTLQVVTEALERIGAKSQRLTPIFVSVDPERDTPKALKRYLSNFHPSFVGLTGTQAEVKAMAKTYKVYFRKVQNKESPGAYTVDHTSILYLMDAKGRYVGHFTHRISPKDLAAKLKARL